MTIRMTDCSQAAAEFLYEETVLEEAEVEALRDDEVLGTIAYLLENVDLYATHEDVDGTRVEDYWNVLRESLRGAAEARTVALVRERDVFAPPARDELFVSYEPGASLTDLKAGFKSRVQQAVKHRVEAEYREEAILEILENYKLEAHWLFDGDDEGMEDAFEFLLSLEADVKEADR